APRRRCLPGTKTRGPASRTPGAHSLVPPRSLPKPEQALPITASSHARGIFRRKTARTARSSSPKARRDTPWLGLGISLTIATRSGSSLALLHLPVGAPTWAAVAHREP